jgi:hypothetical protein
MKRSELEHVLRAAAAITQESDFIIVGSQAILAEYPDAPSELTVSMEVDIFPRDRPDYSILIDGAIGEGSTFHDTFGYYAHGVGPETATVPQGWQNRLVRVSNSNTGGATGWCLEAHDLAVSKLSAGRPRDMAFVGALIRNRLARLNEIDKRIQESGFDDKGIEACQTRLKSLSKA